jgi:hypothetical protein
MCCHSSMQASFASGSIRTACDLRAGGRENGENSNQDRRLLATGCTTSTEHAIQSRDASVRCDGSLIIMSNTRLRAKALFVHKYRGGSVLVLLVMHPLPPHPHATHFAMSQLSQPMPISPFASLLLEGGIPIDDR